jgi:hypothetical protein
MTRQNTKLLIMFIIGLPSLPLACILYLQDRYIVGYQYPPEQRMMGTKEGFIACMCALTFVALVFGIPIYFLEQCK